MPNVQTVEPPMINGVRIILTHSYGNTPWYRIVRDEVMDVSVSDINELEQWFILFLDEHGAKIDDQGWRVVILGVKDGKEQPIEAFSKVGEWWKTNLKVPEKELA